MPAPDPPESPLEIDLDLEDLAAEPERQPASRTRNLTAGRLSVYPFDDAAPPESKPISGPPAGKPYLAGDVIDGKYRLTRVIGRGGMGAVWQAHNLPLDIDVAIKLIRRDLTAVGAAERLLTEARAAARLMHPAIVRVFDFGETDQGDPFIVMELLHGESLRAILRRKQRLSPAVAVQTLLPVAAALVSAHSKGIVHRDLKPDNIIVVVDESGALVPKVVDFGIAKLLSSDVDRGLTVAGEVVGSPDYMSPEQARGDDDVGEATDIWALSVVLYELVTGQLPFKGKNYNALIASILMDAPAPLTAEGPGVGVLAGIVARGLAKKTSARWPRMRSMGEALASWAVAGGIEDDVMGGSIAKQWLARTTLRVLTVQPETGELPQTPPEEVHPEASPWASHPPPTPLASDQDVADSVASFNARRLRAERIGRALLALLAAALLGAVGVAVFLVRERDAARGDAAAASSMSAAMAPAALLPAATIPSSVAAASASVTAPAASAPASAAPLASSHLGPPRLLPRKGKGSLVLRKAPF